MQICRACVVGLDVDGAAISLLTALLFGVIPAFTSASVDWLGVPLKIVDSQGSSQTEISQIQSILAHTQQDVRTMSYLLHPPLVEEGGLFVALEALAQGLSKRMGIPIHVKCGAFEPRLPIEDESALYRVAQEALMNVHRHASATCVTIRYYREGGCAVLAVEDDGVGFGGRYGRRANSGVGILGMRARLEQLGGTIRLSRLDRGTTLRATLPLDRADQASKP